MKSLILVEINITMTGRIQVPLSEYRMRCTFVDCRAAYFVGMIYD